MLNFTPFSLAQLQNGSNSEFLPKTQNYGCVKKINYQKSYQWSKYIKSAHCLEE